MSLDFVASLLEDEWDERSTAEGGPPDRQFRVPKPQIDIELEVSAIRLRKNAHINIADGGPTSLQPLDAGYTHEVVIDPVEIEIRVAKNAVTRGIDTDYPVRTAFDGQQAGKNDGLQNEVKRILNTVRLGTDEYDLIVTNTWQDNSLLTGMNHYLGTWYIELQQRAEPVV